MIKQLFSIFILFSLSASLLAQENNPISCSDGIDNDGDGLIDCEDPECESLPNYGCQTCFSDGLSFADFVIEYDSNCNGIDSDDPQTALGVSDFAEVAGFEFVSLGERGFIKLGFNNNLIVNSGNNDPDIWVFEIGPAVEPSFISLKPFDQITIDFLMNGGVFDIDGDGYFDFAAIAGATSSLDIDNYISGFPFGELKFDAIKITDIDGDCGGSTSGADIDAVCALSTIAIDCNDIINGPSVLDLCGVCLEPDDPNFNLSCVDCNGTPNGTAMLDICGECLEPTDPNFDNSCTDCLGTIDGTAILDSCGVCLEPNDPTFNLSCIDCAGTLNGLAVIDLCEECLLPDDPNFNLSCSEDNKVYIPNVFSPDDDGINDKFEIFRNQEVNAQILTYRIFDRWGSLIHESTNFDFGSNSNWWNGEFKGEKLRPGVYIYYIMVEFQNKEVKEYSGDISITNSER